MLLLLMKKIRCLEADDGQVTASHFISAGLAGHDGSLQNEHTDSQWIRKIKRKLACLPCGTA